MHENVLLPIDLQHEASWSKALPQARRLAGDSGTVHLLGIVPDIGSSMVATFLPKGFEVKALEEMKAALDNFADAEFPPGSKVAVHVGHGHVSETILKVAADVKADMIVMASHRPDELRSILISSHANSVVRHSPVTVMIVRQSGLLRTILAQAACRSNDPGMMTDIQIARQASKLPIAEIAERLGLTPADILPYGHDKAKITHAAIASLNGRPSGRLVLVTAINPTPAGEGKTTTTVGLGDALNRIGKRTTICIREASLGPNFGMKGGAAGGGRAQIVPMEDMNLHFTGDFHAITSAHNLLAAMIDNHVYWGNDLNIDTRRITWRRVMDMNDRALRDGVVGLGGPANGFPRQSGFDITVASEVMAILCLASDLADLQERLGRIVIGETFDRRPVTAHDLGADGAMTVLLKDAMQPNLVQTLENNPALVHGGPFANIAHGCNSVIATRAALAMSDYVVTEAGFGADLGAEKFLDIKCRLAGLAPSAVVLVATIRALKMNGGVSKSDLGKEDAAAVVRGCANLGRHIENLHGFGLPVVVALNHFAGDTDAETDALRSFCTDHGVEAVIARHWAEGGAGAEDLAHAVTRLAESGKADFHTLYPDAMPLWQKIETICTRIYRAGHAEPAAGVRQQLEAWEMAGYGDMPVCIAKTQYSFSTDPSLRGAPEGHVIPVREVRLNAGAGFVVAICGEIMTMPGLPRHPAAETIMLDRDGQVEGLF